MMLEQKQYRTESDDKIFVLRKRLLKYETEKQKNASGKPISFILYFQDYYQIFSYSSGQVDEGNMLAIAEYRVRSDNAGENIAHFN